MWIAPDYTPHTYTKVLAVALVNSESNRRSIEDLMVKRLSAYTTAVPSYQLFPELQKGTASGFQDKVKAEGFNGLLTTRLLGREREMVYTPGYITTTPYYYRNYWGYWNTWYNTWSTPGYYTQYDVYSLETSFVDLTTNALVWSGVTETVDPSSLKDAVKESGDAIMKELRERKVLSQPRK